MKPTKAPIKNNGNTAHRVWSILALTGLFICGLMVGIGAHKNAPRRMIFSHEQCVALSNKISWAIRDNNFSELEQAQKIFARNCAGFVPADVAATTTPDVVVDENLKPCERIELILSDNIDENTSRIENLAYNATVYKRLVANGCPENAQKWQQLYDDTIVIGNGIDKEYFQTELNLRTETNPVKNETTCQEIERLLKSRIINGAGDEVAYHLENADVYSTLAARGCSGNADMYKSLALRELEIVSALSDDELGARDTEIVIDTYKKLNMQNQAREFLNKIQKLTNPAIDFILSMEKIINE